MERLKVLSAALALREFTVDEVATLSGVKPKTVRSVLGRNLDVVQRLESTSQGLRGRPSRRWAVIDSDAARDLTAELRALTGDVETRTPPPFGHTDDDRGDVAVTVAENALAQMVDEHDPSLQREIAATARTALMMADDKPVDAGTEDQPALHWWCYDDSSEAVRARAIDALAALASTGRGGITERQLAATARAVAAAMAIDRSRGDATYFAPFAHLLASRDTFAPLLTFTAPDEQAPTTFIGARWKTLSPSSRDMPFALVTQRWAEPLAAVSAAMPVVFVTQHPSSGSHFAALLERTRNIAASRPAIVISGASARELTRESARAGALFVPINCRRPTRSDRALAIEAVTAAIDRFTARASFADVLMADGGAAIGVDERLG